MHPLDLNSATRVELAESNLLTPFQIEAILKYREQYGPLFSVYELAALPGFRMSRLSGILPFLTTGKKGARPEETTAKTRLLIQSGISLPVSAGFRSKESLNASPPYAGNLLKTGIKLNASLNPALTVGLGFEKDPGEPFFRERAPQFISGYLLYEGTRCLRKMVLGNFQVHQGLGLACGSGFLNSLESLPLLRASPTLAPRASWRENGFESGIGVQMEFGKIRAMIWSSYSRMDLSLQNLTGPHLHTDWSEYERTTGLHRTANENGGRGLAYQSGSGMHVSRTFRRGSAGVMFGCRINGLTGRGKDTLQMNPGASVFSLVSLHGNWFSNRSEIAGEAVLGKNGGMAMLAGWRCRVSDFLRILMVIHHYGTGYRGMNPSAYGSGSRVLNEQGIACLWHFEAGTHLCADMEMEFFRYPGPRYLTKVPTTGYRMGLSISNPETADFRWRLRISRKMWQNTSGEDDLPLPSLKTSETSRLELRAEKRHEVSPQGPVTLLRWQSRLNLSWLHEQAAGRPAFAVTQSLSCTCRRLLSFTLHWVAFNVDQWENRIYLYEPGLYSNFEFPACYGQGNKVVAVGSWKMGRRITLGGKISRIYYHDRNTTGSGNDLRQGNRRWEAAIQFRLNL